MSVLPNDALLFAPSVPATGGTDNTANASKVGFSKVRHSPELVPGQRVEVDWGLRGWLPGTFEEYREGEFDEPDGRVRCRVAMDNGWAFQGQGFAAECVRAAEGGAA
jgi:hypothetical protein